MLIKNYKNLILMVALTFLCFVSISCNNTNQPNSINTVNTISSNNTVNTSGQNILQNTNNSKTSEKEARFDNYNYHYQKEGEKTVALFTKNFLPRDDKVVVGAIRDVIKRAYNEDATGSPLIKNHGGVNKIYLESKKSSYYVTPVKEDTGEVHSLIIERESK